MNESFKVDPEKQRRYRRGRSTIFWLSYTGREPHLNSGCSRLHLQRVQNMHSLSNLLFLAAFCLSGISAAPQHLLRSPTFDSASDLLQQPQGLLQVLQVYPPPLSPKQLIGSTACSYTLMSHVFARSADRPFIGS
jgi:hypothetical protein